MVGTGGGPPALSETDPLLYWAGTPNHHRQNNRLGTVRCALGLHNGSLLVLTANDFGIWLRLRAAR